jgi:membrane-bound metal-dependent hydrolase YbcI (DUF457 family)
MPITPFHFGPGAALHAGAPRHVSFLSFCAANVLIDIESFYNLMNQRPVVHAFFHTYIGATAIVAATTALFLASRWSADGLRLPNPFQWRQLTLRQVAVGAMLGAYSHIVLDSVMHRDMAPLSPFSNANALLGVITLGQLHLLCLALGVLGVAGLGVRWLLGEDGSPP